MQNDKLYVYTHSKCHTMMYFESSIEYRYDQDHLVPVITFSLQDD